MPTAAEQYRKLVAKLEALQEAPVAAFNQNADNAAVGSVAADPAVTPAPAPEPQPTPTQDATQIPTIEASTFSQAYAQAKKQGLKTFKWCGVYAVKDQVKPQPVPPAPKKVDDPMTFAKAYSLRNTPNQPLLKKTDVTQAGPNATNLKPGGGIDFSKQFDVKAVR
jgi:hypothetical protein